MEPGAEVTACLGRIHFQWCMQKGKTLWLQRYHEEPFLPALVPTTQARFSGALVPSSCQRQSGSAPLHPARLLVLAHECVRAGKKCMGLSSVWDWRACLFSFSLKKKVKEF